MNFSQIAALLNKRFKKSKPVTFELDDEERQTIGYSNEKLTSPPFLVLLKLDGPIVIETGAYDKRVRCVLLQKPEKGEF